MPREQGRKLIAQNKKARHDYSILDTYEVGLVLTGTEVKSLRAGRASLVDGFASVDDGEVWLQHVHIPEYTQGTWTNHAPRRKRKVLMHRAEIEKLIGKTKEGGLTLVPLDLYFKDGKVKATLALAKGKKSYDKRQDLAERDSRREMQKAFGRYVKGRRGGESRTRSSAAPRPCGSATTCPRRAPRAAGRAGHRSRTRQCRRREPGRSEHPRRAPGRRVPAPLPDRPGL